MNICYCDILGVHDLYIRAVISREWLSRGAGLGSPSIAVCDNLNILQSKSCCLIRVDTHAIGSMIDKDVFNRDIIGYNLDCLVIPFSSL